MVRFLFLCSILQRASLLSPPSYKLSYSTWTWKEKIKDMAPTLSDVTFHSVFSKEYSQCCIMMKNVVIYLMFTLLIKVKICERIQHGSYIQKQDVILAFHFSMYQDKWNRSWEQKFPNLENIYKCKWQKYFVIKFNYFYLLHPT